MNYELPEDKWFKSKGLKIPKRDVHGISADEISEVLAQNIKGHKCQWEQKGTLIECSQGDNPHGSILEFGKMLEGTDKDGQPILKEFGPILRKSKK